jgi:streptogramin lyase
MPPSRKPNAVRVLAVALGAGLVVVPALPASADETCPAPDEYEYFASSFAGPGEPGNPPQDGGSASEATMPGPLDVAVDADGNVLIADPVDNTVRIVGPDGVLLRLAGNRTSDSSGMEGHAVFAGIGEPAGVSTGPDGKAYLSDSLHSAVYQVDRDTAGIIHLFAGTPGTAGSTGDGGPALEALFESPRESVFGPDGVFYVADRTDGAIRSIGADGIVSTFVADAGSPTGMAADGDGNVYFTDISTGAVNVADPDGNVATVEAALPGAWGVAVDPDGNLFVSSAETGQVQRIAADGTATVIAGKGAGYSGDGGPALDAELEPRGLAVGPDGEIYVAEPENGVVRVLSPVPCALDQELSVESDTRLVADVIGDDVGFRLTVKGYSHPESGSGGISEDGELRFDPEPGFAGVVSMNYSVIDAVGQMSYGTVTITVGDAEGGGGGVLPATGPGLAAALWAASALMGGGAAIVFVARRRRVVR